MNKDEKNLLIFLASLVGLGLFAGWRRGYVTAEFSQVKGSKTIADALAEIAAIYGTDFARDIERLARLETANFTSGQWELYNTAGMEATENNFPFGWGSLAEYSAAAGLDPSQFYIGTMIENQTGKIKTFIGFPDPATFLFFLSWFIENKRGGNFGKWFSLDPQAAAGYYSTMQTIDPQFI